MSEKLIRWCVFGVAIALLPVAFAWVSLLTTGQSATLNEVLENGALLLITAAISGAAIGELVGSGRARIKLKLCAGGGCVVVLMACSLWYAQVSSTTVIRPEVVMWGSIVMFLFGMVSSYSCVVLSEV